MDTIRSKVARLQLFIYLLVAFSVSWVGMVPWLMGSAEQPSLNPFGPVVGAVLVMALLAGGTGVVGFFRRIMRLRGISPATWTAAIILPIAVFAASAVIAHALGNPSRLMALIGAWPQFLIDLLAMLVITGVGEEPGWRGYLQNYLQSRWPPAGAALFMAAIWATWHIPMGIATGSIEMAAWLAAIQFSLCFYFIWLVNQARGAILPAMVAHAIVNVFAVGFVSQAGAYLPTFKIPMIALSAISLLLFLLTKGRLGYKPELSDGCKGG